MIVQIQNNRHNKGHDSYTEIMYDGVKCLVIGDFREQMDNRETKFIKVRPSENKCALVDEIYVYKDCIKVLK